MESTVSRREGGSASEAGAEHATSYWRTQEMLLLQQVMALAGRELDPGPALQEMLHLLSELLGLNRGRIVLLDETAKSGQIRYAYGLTAEEMARGRYALNEGITGRVLASGQLVISQNIDNDPHFLGRMVERRRLPEGPVSFIAQPIRVAQRTLGVLACHRIRHRPRPLADDLQILKLLAAHAGQLLQLHAQMRERTESLQQQNRLLSRALDASASRYGIVGNSPRLVQAVAELEQVSDSTASVLLLGESGTGKELFARALHLASPRREAPFVKVNCAAIPETLFESELFGYEKGAFTGAQSLRQGSFEQADGGTLFLDEIGELPLAMQTKLLRALQEGCISRLGGKCEVRIDVRLVAATNRNLEAEIARGAFRQDLYYRLNVIPIRLPSLAERSGDIPALALHHLNQVNQANQRNVHLTAGAIERLQRYPWPGNIRELGNVIERMVLLCEHPAVDAAEVERFLPDSSREEPSISGTPTTPEPSVSAVADVRPYVPAASHSPQELHRALQRAGGNKTRAAQLLGLTPRQFGYRWDKLGLSG
ncbi:sigma 54-interacting transcriptional regulator [Halomonas sp. JS92-SW72]|uniref:sigma-54 interaction domain-containing protein n=1 Tax=Halomonas sp. JS92-SW72 TaxID=2306583 RepID=UPI0019696FD9|nr:sigma 54-interacting transcriptional regulator [Halomonas sp. JS92-SW72]